MQKIISIILTVILGFVAIFTANSVSAAPPTHFQTQTIISSGLTGPTGFGIAPDGRIFILERQGVVKIFKNGSLLPAPFVTLPSQSTGDRGLIGVAFDPNFLSNKYVYFYYTAADKLNYLVRFTAESDVATGSPLILFQTTTPSEQLHVGGTIAFGLDGKIYFAVGDNGYPPNAQDLTNPHGKILRINPDGSIPGDNPFVGIAGANPAIWAYGLRNPWRFSIDSSGRLWAGDVGSSTWEEINLIEKGKNYGWPLCEGMCITPATTNPAYTYNHDGVSSAVTMGPTYESSLFPLSYQGKLFFGDYARGFIKTATTNSFGQITSVQDFDLSAGSVVDMKIGTDGSMYYLTFWPGRLYRVLYSEGNEIPQAVATASQTSGAAAPFTVNFSAEGSSDPNGDPLDYLWDFGDGNTSTVKNPSHTYLANGSYVVELTVSDGSSSVLAIPITIQVGIAPVVTIGSPAPGTTWSAGDTISYTVHAVDSVGNDISDSQIVTEVRFGHDSHYHPYFGPVTGRAHSVPTAKTGEADPDVWLEIHATATDPAGLIGRAVLALYPNKTNISLNTNIEGLNLLLDGSPITTPYNFEQVVGFIREVEAPQTQILGGNKYRFVGWSNGGARVQTYEATNSPLSLVANYQIEENLFKNVNAQYFNNMNLSGSPVLTQTVELVDFEWGGGSPSPLVQNDGFSARFSKSITTQAGTHSITVRADDGVRVIVDGVMVIDQWKDQAPTQYEHTMNLAAGVHTFVMEYYENAVGATAQMSISAVSPTPTTSPTPAPTIAPTPTVVPTPSPTITPTATPQVGSDWSVDYFAGITLSGSPIFSKEYANIDFNWGMGQPEPTVSAEMFSLRATKGVTLNPNGIYRFTVRADDGVRVKIGGSTVFDRFIDQSATTYNFDYRASSTSIQQIVVEYYEKYVDATLSVSYVFIPDPTVTPSPSPTVTPVPTIVPTPSATPTVAPTIAPTPTPTATPTAAPTMTPHPTMPPVPTTWNVEYFSGITLSGSPIKVEQKANIDYNLGLGAPSAGVPADNFSIRATRMLHLHEPGIYRFTVRADDGVRLKINGATVIDRFIDQSATTYTYDYIAPFHTDHDVVLEYYEKYVDAVLELSWTMIAPITPQPTISPTPTVTPAPTIAPTPTATPTVAPTIAPSPTPTVAPTPTPTANSVWSASFWNNVSLTGAPAANATYPELNFNWGVNSPIAGIRNEDFSARFTRTMSFAPRQYTITVTADDGVRVFVNGVLVIDKWINQSATTYTHTMNLSGNTTITVEYYDHVVDAVLNLSIN